MSIRGSVTLYNSSVQFAKSIGNGSGWGVGFGSSSPPVTWGGGRSILNVTCPNFPPTTANLQVQMLMPDNLTWMQVGSGVLAQSIFTAQMVALDTAAGQYRVFSNSGVIAGLFVTLVGVQYT